MVFPLGSVAGQNAAKSALNIAPVLAQIHEHAALPYDRRAHSGPPGRRLARKKKRLQMQVQWGRTAPSIQEPHAHISELCLNVQGDLQIVENLAIRRGGGRIQST
jgi:hypothetical protein